MHHTLPFYGRYQKHFLRAYMTAAHFTGIPVLGAAVRALANTYARRQHGGFALKRGEAEQVVEASGWVAVGRCACRETFHNCNAPVEAEIAVGFGKEVYRDTEHEFREVSKEEAKTLIQNCREAGLMSIMMQCRGHYYAICNCCTCCCVPYRLKKDYGVELAVSRDAGIVDNFIKQVTQHAD